MLGSAGLTIPAAWYLWPDSSHGDAHGPNDAHAKQSEEHPDAGEPQEEQPQEEEKPQEESSDDESKGGALKGGEGEATQDQPQAGNKPAPGESKSKPNTEGANQPENKGDVAGVKFKGPTNEGDENNKMPDERKREPDGKGGFKKRIDSGYGKNLGEGPEKRDDGSQSVSRKRCLSLHTY